MRKRILYLTNDDTDYLSDSIFHGLRLLLGSDVVDFPKANRMYRSAPHELIDSRRGHGFTLYGTLEDIPIDRPEQVSVAHVAKYDLVIVADIWRQVQLFNRLRAALDEHNTVILDGSDVPSLYKYAGTFWRNADLRGVSGTGKIPYFKRELMPETLVYRWYMALPLALAKRLIYYAPYRQTAFGIPGNKIVTHLPLKDKLLGSHIVDPDVAGLVIGSSTGYAFTTEESYYADLQRSRFAVTTKRAGWDCLRHYEIAANACVPCFRDLHLKSEYCAPHGLNETNCVMYTSASDLLLRIQSMTEVEYQRLQQGALRWAQANTTVARACEMLTGSKHTDFLTQSLGVFQGEWAKP